jgi:large subunit ribosomal protein L29
MASKAAELRELPEDELLARVESAKEELFNLRFQLATGQLDNTARMKELRHDVARVATVLREREIEAELDAIASRANDDASASQQQGDDAIASQQQEETP